MEENKKIKQRGNGKHKNICHYCAEHFLGRKNGKFCSDQCKNDCNNEIYSNLYQRVKEIDQIFHQNRKIAEEVANSDKAVISHLDLLKKGYNLKFYTHKVNVSDNLRQQECQAIYEYVLIPVEKTPVSYKIIYNDEY